jgi:hypothetical protein
MRAFGEIDRRNGLAVLCAALSILGCAPMPAAAQSKSPPSWGPVQQPSSPAQPSPGPSLNGAAQNIPTAGQAPRGSSPNAQRQNTTSAALNTPPTSRDCRKAITQADPSYTVAFGKAETNGYTSGPNVDFGFIINTIRAMANNHEGNHNDLQVRIEQLRCENQNLEAKLDYIIRRLP